MPVLAYCLSEIQPVAFSGHGVADLPVESLEHNGIRCFFSRSATRDQILSPPAKQMALEFHRVIASIFQDVAVIPFRFPTLLEDEAELRNYLAEEGAIQREALIRLRNFIQMEIHLSHASGSANSGAPDEPEILPAKISGTEYLVGRQTRQRELAELGSELRQSGGSLVREWRERPSGRGLRCYALIERDAVEKFKHWIAGIPIGSEFGVRVSGPWPASEFLEKI